MRILEKSASAPAPKRKPITPFPPGCGCASPGCVCNGPPFGSHTVVTASPLRSKDTRFTAPFRWGFLFGQNFITVCASIAHTIANRAFWPVLCGGNPFHSCARVQRAGPKGFFFARSITPDGVAGLGRRKVYGLNDLLYALVGPRIEAAQGHGREA